MGSTTTTELIDALLLQREGSALDYKRDQYQFINATDDLKSELLKDILAFANSWAPTTRYILIGAEEIAGAVASPVGIGTSHLDDASLQQFVNTKVNRVVEFTYLEQPFDGKTIAIMGLMPDFSRK